MVMTSETHSTAASTPNNGDATAWRSHPFEALMAINNQLLGNESHDGCTRSVNFMSYELATVCHNKTEIESLEAFNDFFFGTKKFRFSPEPVLIQNIVSERCGCGIALALLYMHLAKQIGLQLQLIHWPLHTILKWEHAGRAKFIDLEQQGKILSEEELLSMINKHKDQVRTLALHEALVQYLAYVSMSYRQSEDYETLHKALSLILRLEPENTRFLAERAILRRDLSLFKESLSDFKRYFSFTDISMASPEVIAVYETVRILNI